MSAPAFREAPEETEAASQITRLRLQRGLTQTQLADLLGATQSSIARLESGNREPSLSFLRRAALALRGRLEVRVIAETAPEEM